MAIREDLLRMLLSRELAAARAREYEGKHEQASEHFLRAAALHKRLTKLTGHDSGLAHQYEQVAANLQSPETNTQPSEDAIAGLVITEKPNVRFEDIGGLEEAKQALREAVLLPLIRKPDYVQSPRSVLLFGPPGTGKTMLAKAAASILQGTFLDVRLPTLLSKYFGESPKLVSALFSFAGKHQPAVLFADELDALATSRDIADEPLRRVLSQFLVELDGFREQKLFFLGATNRPWDLDDALLSRFQKKIW